MNEKSSDGQVMVFVYGTLKRGESNYHVMERAKGEYVKDGALPQATLYNFGFYPGLKRGPVGGLNMVQGEVFSIPADRLWVLDRLEGHPRFYRREEATLVDGTEVVVYEYQGVVAEEDYIPSGVWPTSKEAV